ncbi:MAG: hypothetical protein NT159_12405 [Proteobacteria bacterium]|nr:hypothetical protein [Pseudomonadota bacterium]
MGAFDALCELDQLVEAVRRNCCIADARHAREMTMCNYLLEMREYCRWERGIPPGGILPARSEIGAWLSAREALWEAMEDEDYGVVPVGGQNHQPFESEAINESLQGHGLIYGSGVGRFHKPHFFLARLIREDRRDGLRILVCGREYARDLTAIPAVLRGDTIIIRGQALRQWLWEKVEAWQAKRSDGALQAALDSYGYGNDAGDAMERMADAVTELLVLHEQGEHAAGRLLGPAWEEMLAASLSKHAEVLARSVRDNLADCLVTLPALLENDARGLLHFWFANFDGMRLALFPSLAAAYHEWRANDDRKAFQAVLADGCAHWRGVAEGILARYELDGEAAEAALAHWSGDQAPIAL